jgi:hypothetical protein
MLARADSSQETDMLRNRTLLVMVGAAIIVAVSCHTKTVGATSARGFESTTLALGHLGDMDVFNHSVPAGGTGEGEKDKVWLSLQKTRGSSDLYVESNVWQPGGSTGWHSHPGHSLIIVTAGTVTDYDGDDPRCKPAVYSQGMSFVDSGDGHVHLLRNEGSTVAQTIAVQLIPAGATRRIDAREPGNCHF